MTTAPNGAGRVRPARLAKLLGVTRQSVHELIERGVLNKGADGLLDLEASRAAIAARMHPGSKTSQAVGVSAPPAAPPPASPPGGDGDDELDDADWKTARTVRERANARMDVLRMRKMQGELAELKPLEEGFFKVARMLRDMVLNVPKRVAAEAVASGDPRVAERLMTDGLRRAFEDFGKLAKDELQRAELRSKDASE